METNNFYTSLRAFQTFSDLSKNEHFVTAPEDWHVVLTDIAGSTKAVQEGRAKEVNMIGASAITCVMNALGNSQFPYVFGGDGATLLVSSDQLLLIKPQLEQLIAHCQVQFGLTLRVGIVSIAVLRSTGREVLVGKYELSPGNVLAQFRGGGLSEAERLIKTKDPSAELLAAPLPETSSEVPLNLNGLSCRLQPLKSVHGHYLTLLIQPQLANAESSELSLLLSQILEDLRRIVGKFDNELNPQKLSQLKWKWWSPSLLLEAKLNGTHWFKIVFEVAFVKILDLLNLKVGGFDGTRYKQEVVLNSDSKKFDEVLRMVLDCTLEQAVEIENMLNTYRNKKLIAFGIHKSSEALMTCMVQSATQNQHVHFIDGAGGGYTLAAVQLKKQLKETSV